MSGLVGNLNTCFVTTQLKFKKVEVGKDQEKAQSEKDSHSKNRGGKKTNQQSGTYTMKHIVSRMSSYFPNRWPLSYLNLTKNMKTYIRRQQHKKGRIQEYKICLDINQLINDFWQRCEREICIISESYSNFVLLIVPSRYFCGGSFCFMSWCITFTKLK